MGGKAAVGGGLVMGLLVGAAIVAGAVVLVPGPEAPSAVPVVEASATPAPSDSSSIEPSPSTDASPDGSGSASLSASSLALGPYALQPKPPGVTVTP